MSREPGDIAAVIAVLGPDLTAEEWSKRLGVSLSEVRLTARVEGVLLRGQKPPRQSLPKGAEGVIVAARKGGATLIQLAEMFGVDHALIWRVQREEEAA